MTTTITPATATPVGVTLDTTIIPIGVDFSAGELANTGTEPIFLRAATYELTARHIVCCLAAHLAELGDTFDPHDVDAPLWAIDIHMRFDGDLTGWATGRTPAELALMLARAEQIAVGYFGHRFPALAWTQLDTQQAA